MSKEVNKLEVVPLAEIILEPAQNVNWVVEEMICVPGLYILAGPPKAGKSWLSLILGISISSGNIFLGFPTCKSDVLYLALEDTISRLQGRAWKLLDEFEGNLDFAISSCKINEGLIEQLEDYFVDHPDCGVIIIDTLQMVRSSSSDCKYASDYADLSPLKKFADEHNIAISVVHHTRKMRDTDVFSNISGAHGISGCADGMLVLDQVNRADGSAVLKFTGRDCGYCELKLRFHDCQWELIERTSQEELEEREIPDEIIKTVDFIKNYDGVFEGSTTDLYIAIGITEITPIAFGKRLAQHKSFLESRCVKFERRRTAKSAIVRLEFIGEAAEEREYNAKVCSKGKSGIKFDNVYQKADHLELEEAIIEDNAKNPGKKDDGSLEHEAWADGITPFTTYDTPQNDPVNILLKKVDSRTHESTPQGGATLKDA